MNICVIGANGQLGRHIFEKFKKNNNFFFFSSSLKKKQFLSGNLTNTKILLKKVKKIKPKIIINCSAYTQVDLAELHKKKAKLINSDSLKILSNYCFKNNIFLIHFSTDYVYSGIGTVPWKETFKCHPVNFYGYSKYLGEKNIINSKCKFIILRLSWLYGPFGNSNFVLKIIKNLKINKKLNIVKDQIGSPTSTNLVIQILKKILIKINKNEMISGIFNLCPKDFISRSELSYFILKNYFKKNDYKNMKINEIRTKDLKLMVRRPLNSKMNINKISNYLNIEIKSWKFYLKKYLLSIK